MIAKFNLENFFRRVLGARRECSFKTKDFQDLTLFSFLLVSHTCIALLNFRLSRLETFMAFLGFHKNTFFFTTRVFLHFIVLIF